MKIIYEQHLNKAQLEAIMLTEGPVLVIAGAGSGKTRTLTYRVAYLVEKGIAPGAILLLTFTRKASQEMLKRASLLLDSRCENVAGGTFHSFANLTLRRFSSTIGIDTGFSIMDRADMESLIAQIRKEMGLNAKELHFPRKSTLADIFSKSVNKHVGIEDLVFSEYPQFGDYLDEILSLNNQYTNRKITQNLVDYDDLLVLLLKLLAEKSNIRSLLSSRYQYIMVDEFQDTNHIQSQIVEALASGHRNIMAVGDDSQSIYAFRGANFQNIMDFPLLFPDTRIIRLEENYRSFQPILDFTNAVIDKAENKYTKNLFTRRKGGTPPQLVCTENENVQSRFVIENIYEKLTNGVSINDIAVLFRAGFHSFDLEVELNKENIPFVKYGGFKFMESAHIKDVLAHLRVLANPYDRISWNRCFLMLDGIGPKNARRLTEQIVAEHNGIEGFLSGKFKLSKKISIDKLKSLFSEMTADQLTVQELGEQVFDYYMPILRSAFDDHPRRTKDLEQLMSMMERYGGLDHFLTDMALEPPTASLGESFAGENIQGNRLVLSTVHSAKGLEWKVVFIIWALDGRFPSVHAFDRKEDMEEELRLMYVAATRAKENLFLIYPVNAYDRGSGMVFSRPSRFLAKIPQSVLEHRFVPAF